MGELPIFTSSAHVFTIDPKTKKTWIPSSLAAVEINYFFDPTKNCFRIVSIEDSSIGKKVIINSTLTEKMTFKKTSQKFGQWTDSKQSTIFGLGFNSENDLDLFGEKFKTCIDSMKKKSNDLQGDNCNNKEFKKELSGLNNNLVNVSGSGRQWSCSNSTSPNINNNNTSKVMSLEAELERMNKKFEDLKIQHQSEIKRMKEELDYSNTGALANTVDNFKGVKELRQRVNLLEMENGELKKKVLTLSECKTNNSLHSQLPSLMSVHQQMESVITQLNSCQIAMGQKLSDIITSQSSDLKPPTTFGL